VAAEDLQAGKRCANVVQITTAPLLIVQQGNITRSKEEAIEILRKYEAQIKSDPDKASETFKELAMKHSDCSSHEASGDLGWFGPGQMQKAFEDGTYALEIGQISDVISSDSGVHLIMRTG